MMSSKSVDALLASAAERLPPDLLRIIASKYRRAFEIIPCPCPDAIATNIKPILDRFEVDADRYPYLVYYAASYYTFRPYNMVYILRRYLQDDGNEGGIEVYVLEEAHFTSMIHPPTIKSSTHINMKCIYDRKDRIAIYVKPTTTYLILATTIALLKRYHYKGYYRLYNKFLTFDKNINITLYYMDSNNVVLHTDYCRLYELFTRTSELLHPKCWTSSQTDNPQRQRQRQQHHCMVM